MRQYIGARYTIKVYENSQDPSSAEWESGASYERLVMVTYLNSSYLSKKDVPQNIGNPADNPEYWVVTGYYNGQIASLQDQIDAINAVIGDESSGIIKDIDDITADISDIKEDIAELNTNTNMWHNKKVCVYGDSLSTVTYQYWQYMVAADPTIDVTNRAVAGTRIQDGVTLLTAATSADLSQFDIIVLAYGTNSWANTSLREMVNKYKEAFDILATKAPNAQVVTIAPYYTYDPDFGADSINDLGFSIYDYATAICHISNMFGITTFNLYESTGVNQFNYADFIEESAGGIYVHENEALGRKIADILLTGHPYTGSAQGYTYISMGDGVGLLIIKADHFTLITQRGTIPYSAFANVAIPHIAPAYNAQGYARNQATGEIGLVVVNSGTGEFTFAFASGDTPTNIQGLQIFGINGAYQPADV